MTPIKETVIPIHPSTHVRSTKNETWLLSDGVTYEYLESLDDKRLVLKGKRGTLAARKKQLEIHNEHKREIRDWVVNSGFKMPMGYFAVFFCVPMPKSWRPKKREQMINTFHQSTPDLDNYLKQLFDSIMPRKNRLNGEKGCDDRKIFCYAAFKKWVEFDDACIVVSEYDKDEFIGCFSTQIR